MQTFPVLLADGILVRLGNTGCLPGTWADPGAPAIDQCIRDSPTGTFRS